jgi:demethylmenaquinone methyltransferase/2-methoxy-6-polyprenyl-1,4-benzoquinol methylase
MGMPESDDKTLDTRQADGSGVDDLLASQIDYYRAHASRYDDWWRRTGKHDLGEDYRLRWEAEIAELDAILASLAPLGDVLEFAGGTGNWTAKLVPFSDSITVVDASPEAVAIAQSKIGEPKVSWVIDDIFDHKPVRRYDTVFFSFWLSHVPPERFDQFWDLVSQCLVPTGRVVFIDSAHPALSRDLSEHKKLWSESTESTFVGIDSRTNLETGISSRLAADGSTYGLVKIWRSPEDLQSQVSVLGWAIEANTTETAFLYGHGQRPSRSIDA